MASPPRTDGATGQAGPTPQRVGPLGRFRPRLSLLPLRARGFRLLVIGQATSEFGNAFQVVTLPLLVYAFGGGARQLSLVVAAYGAGRLVATPLGGTCADRWGAWRVMMAADLGRLLVTAALAVVAARHVEDFYLIGALAGLVGLGAGLFLPAAWAIAPSLLPAEQLGAGNALSSTVNFGAGLVGPAVAGLVVAWLAPAVALTVDAATFAVSVLTLLLIGRGPFAAPAPEVAGRAAVPRNFLALLRESRLLRNVLTVTVVANLTMGGMTRVALPTLATHGFGAGAIGFGSLLAAFTGGALVGGLVVGGLTGLPSRGRTAMTSGLVMGVAVGLVPFTGLFGALAMLAVAGVASTVTNVLVVTGVQRNTPPALLARVMAAITFCGLGIFPLSVIAVGAAVAAFGSRGVFVATGLSLLAAFSYALTRSEMRGL
ncbi:MFS transporter [Kitasatospora viridis]|uniref:Putative MFS family arabinose efflux permease n=1 Tax=Kitasatospora viridis TaxID=281105 RepID=A0A561SFP1_9ACTN|nr:MFS transporter [Kitasatospora viridis]TWF73680.1 putative MFS family arabinose efflux permease [Kitasatospora viridis]